MKHRYTHVIDAAFPIAVFFVFAASSLAVLLLAARLYSATSTAAENHYTARTAFAYVLEKVRQNDEGGGIALATIEGQDCIALTRTTNGITTVTYIYEDDGMLRELRVREGIGFSLDDGSDIAPVQSFSITALNDTLYAMELTCQDGTVFSLTFGERSVP